MLAIVHSGNLPPVRVPASAVKGDSVYSDSKRFPARAFDGGVEPDTRYSLANERTFLAWIRTCLALVAGGVALNGLNLGIHPSFRLTASIVLLAAGIITPLQAWLRWIGIERSLRNAAPIPAPRLALPLGIAVVVVGLLVLVGGFMPWEYPVGP